MDPERIIPEPEQASGEGQTIPQTAALLPEDAEAPEALPFKLSFARYNNKECEMNSMNGDCAKATLTILRDVGVFYISKDNYQKNEGNGVSIEHVIRDGDYKAVYQGLEDDVEVKEIKHKDDRKDVDLRIFFYTIEAERIFYLIAARHSHYDTSKGSYDHKKKKKSRLGRWR